jgi:hypothetical protein
MFSPGKRDLPCLELFGAGGFHNSDPVFSGILRIPLRIPGKGLNSSPGASSLELEAPKPNRRWKTLRAEDNPYPAGKQYSLFNSDYSPKPLTFLASPPRPG